MGLKLSDSKTIDIRNDFDTDSHQLFTFLKLFLNEMGVQSKIEESRIIFRSVKGSTTNFGNNLYEAIRIIREGEVKIIRLNDKRIKLRWKVRLNILLFMSMLFGVMMSTLAYIIVKAELLAILSIGLSIWFIVFFIGYLWIIILMRIIIQNTIKNIRSNQY